MVHHPRPDPSQANRQAVALAAILAVCTWALAWCQVP